MQISITKIIKADFIALICVIVPLVVLVFFIDSITTGGLQAYLASKKGTEEILGPYFLLGMFIVAAVVCGYFLKKRVRVFTDHFKNGIEVQGKIIDLNFHKDRGTIEYEYMIQNKLYRSSNFVHKNKLVKTLQIGQPVSLVVSNSDLTKAYLKTLYVK